MYYSLWAQGRDDAPKVVRRIFDRWERMVGVDRVHVVEGPELDRHIAELGFTDRTLTVQARSDMLRMKLLAERGGVRFDATVLPMPGMEAWIDTVLDGRDFFAFARPRRDMAVSNWFLASRSDNAPIRAWLANTVAFFRKDRRLPHGGYLHLDDVL